MTLYDLTGQYKALMEMMYDPDVDEETLRDTMEAIQGEIRDKADGYAKIIVSMKSDIEALEKEEKRLAAKRESLKSRMKSMKDNLEYSMRATGNTKFKTDLFSFGIQGNGGLQPLVIDVEVKDIPAEYLVPQDPVPNNKAIRDLLATQKVTWAHLEPRGESLRIK